MTRFGCQACLGWTYERLSRTEGTMHELREAQRLAPSGVEAFSTLDVFYLRHGQPAKAVQRARQRRELYSKDPTARQFLCETKHAAGDENE